MVIVILTLSVILAVVLLAAAVVSFIEYRSRSRPRDACRLLDKQLRLEEQALDAERENRFAPTYGQQKIPLNSRFLRHKTDIFYKIFPACSFDKTAIASIC